MSNLYQKKSSIALLVLLLKMRQTKAEDAALQRQKAQRTFVCPHAGFLFGRGYGTQSVPSLRSRRWRIRAVLHQTYSVLKDGATEANASESCKARRWRECAVPRVMVEVWFFLHADKSFAPSALCLLPSRAKPWSKTASCDRSRSCRQS